MKKGWIFGPALLALAVGGCNQKSGGQAGAVDDLGPLAKGVYAFEDCNPKDEIVGRVNIIVPNQIGGEFAVNDRAVNYGQDNTDENDDETGEGNSQFKTNAPNAPEPFDVFMNMTDFGDVGYVRVRVIIRNGAKWDFYRYQDPTKPRIKFNGVATNVKDDKVLCGITKITERQGAGNKTRRIAKFYVNLAKLKEAGKGYEAPFTIALVAKRTKNGKVSDTPILLDPKVRNDGGGPIPAKGPK